ncbi:MAG: hypothetical protein AB7U81_01650 [Thiohalomonadaceae bacterium]
MRKTSVLVAKDHGIIREGTRALLASEGKREVVADGATTSTHSASA